MTEEMSSEHQAILEEVAHTHQRIDALAKDMEIHVAETHASLVSHADLDASLTKSTKLLEDWIKEATADRRHIRQQLHDLADVVLGEKTVNFDGEVERKGGLKDAIDGNRVRFALPWPQVWTLIGVIITAAGGVIAAIIGAG